MKKIVPLVFILTGTALLVAVAYFLLEPTPKSTSGNLLNTVGTILGFLLGAGANIKGWMELLKKDESKRGVHFINEGEYIMGDKNIYYPPSVQSIQSILYQLPSPPADFTGRETEIATILYKIRSTGMNIFALQGMGGIGKTSLILKLANLLKESYPDGQFFLDLRGTDSQMSLPPNEAMKYVILSIRPDQQIPEDMEKTSALYRSVLHGKRAILVWDNARDGEQVKQLLIDGCLTLITSREHFVLPGMDFIELKELSEKDAKELIKRIAKHINLDDASQLAKLCGYLALAIRVSASTLAERSDLAVPIYLQRLQAAQIRLNLVDASIQLSYDLLDKNLRRRFCQLSFVGKYFFADVAQCVWGLDEIELVDEFLGILIRKSLLEYDLDSQEYYFHDLIELFAQQRFKENPEDYQATLTVYKKFILVLGAKYAKYYINLPGNISTDIPRTVFKSRMLEVRQRLINLRDQSRAIGINENEVDDIINGIDNWFGHFL